MKLLQNLNRKGSMLVKAVITTTVISVSCVGVVKMTQYHNRKQESRTLRADAFYTAENILLEGLKKIAEKEDKEDESPVGLYYLNQEGSDVNLPYSPGDEVKYGGLKIEGDPRGILDTYLLTSSAKVQDEMRTIQALVAWHPAPQVFDYEYFLNNWGWWWGGDISGWGDNRSNWDFDFKDNPFVYGHVFANGNIETNMVPVDPFTEDPPFDGLAGDNPLSYCHVGVPRLPMPNLNDLSYYEENSDGSIVIHNETIVNNIHGDNESKNGLYLEGTYSKPIEINGRVVVRGDCVIKGYISGQGVLYVGGNLYVAGSIMYKNGPEFDPPPATMVEDGRDDWVMNNVDKDLVAFAVKESIYCGMVNTGSWRNFCYKASNYGLKYVGDESELGADGIANTPDDGIPYLDTNDDGVPDSAWYDADGDGIVDDNYDYEEDIQMTDDRIEDIARYPTHGNGQHKHGNHYGNYNHVSNDQIDLMEGVYYTNHAFASRSRRGPQYFHGSIISRDEAIIFNVGLRIRYDYRIHSSYRGKYYNDQIIDLPLPVAEEISIIDRYEIPPQYITDSGGM